VPDRPTGINGKTLPLFIALLAGDHPVQPCTKKLIEESLIWSEKELGDRFFAGLNAQKRTINDADRKQYFEWCLAEINKRVAPIVEGQHRWSYENAAMLIVAMSETVAFRQGVSEAVRYVDGFHKKYMRYNAFRRELREHVALSHEK
jgi:hypothetical protein